MCCLNQSFGLKELLLLLLLDVVQALSKIPISTFELNPSWIVGIRHLDREKVESITQHCICRATKLADKKSSAGWTCSGSNERPGNTYKVQHNARVSVVLYIYIWPTSDVMDPCMLTSGNCIFAANNYDPVMLWAQCHIAQIVIRNLCWVCSPKYST